MHHALRDGHALPRRELDPPALQLDDEPSLHHVKELVLPVALVPVELPLDHADVPCVKMNPVGSLRIHRALLISSSWLPVGRIDHSPASSGGPSESLSLREARYIVFRYPLRRDPNNRLEGGRHGENRAQLGSNEMELCHPAVGQ